MRIPKSLQRWREQRRARLHAALLRDRHPRFAFTVIVLLTGLMGFLVSASLHALGMSSMPWRYGLSVTAAYGVFVLLVWMWLRREHLDEVPDFTPSSSGSGSEGGGDSFGGGGGNFGGGGASSGYDVGEAASGAVTESGGAASEVFSGAGEAVGGALGEGCAPVVILGLLLAGVGVVGWWVLSFAPMLAAEFLADALLMALLYRRMRRFDEPVLLRAIVLRTRATFAVALVVIVLAAAWVQSLAPGATTLGQVFSHYRHIR